MRNQQFTGTFGGNSGTNVLSPRQGQDPFLNSTPAPKPMNATRTGATFAGTVSARLPRASNSDPGFAAISLPADGRESMGRLGERAANEDIRNFNAAATAANTAATTAKQQEIDGFNQTVAELDQSKVDVDNLNSLADRVNQLADVYRNANTTGAKSDYEAALADYNAAKQGLSGNSRLSGLDGFLDDGGKQIQYDNAAAYSWNIPYSHKRDGYGYNDYNFGDGVSGRMYGVSVEHRDRLANNGYGNDRYKAYQSAGGPGYRSTSIYNSGPSYYSQYGYFNQPVYNPWSGEVFANHGYGTLGKDAANVPYAFGQYDNSADQYSWYDVPEAPDSFVELQQMKNELPDAPQRRLAPGQREVVGGDLPPQEATTTGDTFSQFDVPFKEAGELNAAERQRLGAPKAYRVPAGFWTAKGEYGQWGGQTIDPSDITNTSSNSYYIRNYGWVPKDQLTPLY